MKFRITVLFCLIILGAMIIAFAPRPELVTRDIHSSWVELTRRMGIRNMVTAIYLGPRLLDTFLEVMVVVLTVFGMKYIREK